jgi:hypothetical protein
MTFINSALLAGLAAVAIPLIIHLFSRRRFPRIDFSTLRFLKRLQRQQLRRLKLRQWLLLLLRMLGILLIALGFARPALTGRSGFGALSSGRVGMAIVLDGSAGLQARARSGSVFQEAKSAAEALVSSMNSGDRSIIVLAQDKPVALTPSPLSDPQALRRALNDAQAWDGAADLSTAITFAAEALRSSPDFRSEIYVISDFAADPHLSTPPEEMALFFVQAQSESPENLSIADVKVSGEIIESGQPVQVEVTLANHGKRDREDVYYSLFLNGVRVAEDVVSLAAGSQVHRQHEVLPEATGLQEGTVQIDDQDALAVDNKAYFCFAVPGRIKVLLAGEPEAVRALQLALAPSPEKQHLIELQVAGRDQWDTGSLSGFDAIIFADPPTFQPSQAARLARFVENGGGLMLFPGSRTDLAAINRDLLSRLGTPQWAEIMGKAGAVNAFLSWQEPDLNQPLLKGMLRPGSKPALPRFYQAIRLVGGRIEAPIIFHNSLPFLTRTFFGRGRVILAASSPEITWSDWSQRGIFAPLVHRLTLSLAGGQKERCQSLVVGDDFEVQAGSEGAAVASLVQPDGQELKIPPQVMGQKTGYLQPRVNPAGLYHLKIGSSDYLAAANVPADESNLIAADLPSTYPRWRDAGVVVARPQDVVQAAKASRYGRELWKTALLAGLLVLGLESLLGSTFGQKPPPEDEKQE